MFHLGPPPRNILRRGGWWAVAMGMGSSQNIHPPNKKVRRSRQTSKKSRQKSEKFDLFLFGRLIDPPRAEPLTTSPSFHIPGGPSLNSSFCYLIVFVGGTLVRSGTLIANLRVEPLTTCKRPYEHGICRQQSFRAEPLRGSAAAPPILYLGP